MRFGQLVNITLTFRFPGIKENETAFVDVLINLYYSTQLNFIDCCQNAANANT